MKQIEVMAPVGSWEGLQAALQAGANSVYFGVGNLNMRSRTGQNFTVEDLSELAANCRQAGVRSYVTLNTVMYDGEIAQMKAVVDAVKQAGIDAVIAADTAVIQYAAARAVPIHISTQANVSNLEAVHFYARFADVIVLARELNLDQVREITDTIRDENICGPAGKPIRIEMFVHGALCMAVSGKCYLSLDHYNSSANRGSCLQLCRRGYTVFDKSSEVELEIDHEYILSPKDLNTIGFLDQIIAAGVEVLKIEGRGRSPDYVKAVTSAYREAVDAIQSDNYTPEAVADWNERLARVFNRGFWGGYYLGRKMGEWTQVPHSQATRRKEYVGLVFNYFNQPGVAEIRMDSGSIAVGDELLITGNKTGVQEQVIQSIRVEEKQVETSGKGEHCCVKLDAEVRRGDKVFKLIRRD
jgi:U32 family peptidase